MTYEKAMAELVEFDSTDVITTSGGTTGDTSTGDRDSWCFDNSWWHGGCSMGSKACSDYDYRAFSYYSVED